MTRPSVSSIPGPYTNQRAVHSSPALLPIPWRSSSSRPQPSHGGSRDAKYPAMHLNIYISSAFKLVVDFLYILVDLFPMLVSDRNPGRSLQFLSLDNSRVCSCHYESRLGDLNGRRKMRIYSNPFLLTRTSTLTAFSGLNCRSFA